jgi:hypothetical protein
MALILTIACPEAHIAKANHLAMALGYSEADAQTYRNPSWQDTDGNLYACASLPVNQAFTEAAFAPLERPEWDVDEIIDLAAATEAQSLLVFWMPSEENPEAPLATPNTITAIGGPEGLEALVMMGLTIVET